MHLIVGFLTGALIVLSVLLGVAVNITSDLSERLDTVEKSLTLDDSVMLELADLRIVVSRLQLATQAQEGGDRWKEVVKITNAASTYYAATLLASLNPEPDIKETAAFRITAAMTFDPVLTETWKSVLEGDVPTWAFDMLMRAHLFKALTEAMQPIALDDADPSQANRR